VFGRRGAGGGEGGGGGGGGGGGEIIALITPATVFPQIHLQNCSVLRRSQFREQEK